MSEAPEHETFIDEVDLADRRKQRWRIGALAAFVVVSLAVVHFTGLADKLDVQTVRAFVASAGWWGFLVYWVIFALGVLVHIPSAVFVGAGTLAYGNLLGMLLGYLGALLAAMTSFVVVRAIGGQPLGAIERPWVRKVFARLDTHPVTTVVILRALFFCASWLNYGCALSSIRARDYLIGSVIGLIPQAVGYALLVGWLADWIL